MINNRFNFVGKESQGQDAVKLFVFVITLMSPTIFMYVSPGRLVVPFFFLFPAGFLYLIFPFALPNLVIGWVVYIWLIIVGVRSRKPRMFLYMYSLFVVLMLINLKGCNVLLEDPSNTSW